MKTNNSSNLALLSTQVNLLHHLKKCLVMIKLVNYKHIHKGEKIDV